MGCNMSTKISNRMKRNSYQDSDDVKFICKKIQHRIKYLQFIAEGIKFYGTNKYKKNLAELGLLKKLSLEPFMNNEEPIRLSLHEKECIDFIISECLKEYKTERLSKRDVLSKKRGASVHLSRLVLLLIIETTALSQSDLAKYFKRSRMAISKHIQIANNMINSNKKDIRFIQKYNSVNYQLLKKQKQWTEKKKQKRN